MGKIKKLLSIFTAALVAVSLALSSGVASAFSKEEIAEKISGLLVHYPDNNNARTIGGHAGWLSLFSDVLHYAEVAEADLALTEGCVTDNWADWIVRPNGDGFQAALDAEENNLRAMLTNFGHDEGYWQSGWRVKDDFNLLLDWGAIYYTVQHRDGREKPYKGIVYDSWKFLNKVREIYNLNPETNQQKHDALCLRALFRAMVAYDKALGAGDREATGLDSFVDAISVTGLMERLIFLNANEIGTKRYLGTNEDFSLLDRLPRQNAADFYKKLARLLLSSYYTEGENLLQGQEKIENRDYKIIFDANGYVVRLDPIINPQNGNGSGDPNLITLKPGQGDKAGAAGGGGGGSDLRGRIIKGTGSGIDHFSAAIVALAVSASGIAGLGYVASRKRRKNVK